ncbi:hypothetical protein ACLOJK_023658 [Asimina triloba]
MASAPAADANLLSHKISAIFDECRLSYAVHPRKLKELSALQSSPSSKPHFFPSFSQALKPLFDFPRKTAAAERIVRFVSIFAARRDEKHAADCDAFQEDFLKFLLAAAGAANKNARFRSCQIISEIIMRLPDDAEVSSEAWDDVIDSMKNRVGDKIPAVRMFAVRALARFANDSENADIVELLLEALPVEQNAEVRKTIILSLPASNTTSASIIGCTLDVSESVRKASYCVLANKFPLQSLSIKLRTVILQRGLSDRSPVVVKECLKLMRDEWLMKSCKGDPVILLKYLDVETYESVGETVMEALLKAGMVHIEDGWSIRQFLGSTCETTEGEHISGIQLMEAEAALYWRITCRHLQVEAQIKGTNAATTAGTEAAVYAAEASERNDLLERVLPATISDFVELVKAHLAAGPTCHFASRQLLLLGTMLDFSDATNRKVAGSFVQELLNRPLEHEVDDEGNKVVIGDGINVGGDRDWARTVSELAKKVHASVGEYEEVFTGVIKELALPCRERTADFMQWMHCLAVTGLLLENIKSLQCLNGKAIEASELLYAILLPGVGCFDVKHIHVDVQRVATRCLGLFGLVEKKPSEDLVRQLRLSYANGPYPVRVMATKALMDLVMWHGPRELDRALGLDLSSKAHDSEQSLPSVNLGVANADLTIETLDLLNAGLDQDDCEESVGMDDHETVKAILGEGFAKFLLLSDNYSSVPASLHPLLLGKLINLYFNSNMKELLRLKQCLSVFFEHYPALSADHKKSISEAFIPVMRSMWPGIYGNAGGAPIVVSAQRKRATQASRFMLQMLQTPVYPKESMEDQCDENSPEGPHGSVEPSIDIESGEEGLAIRIAVESPLDWFDLGPENVHGVNLFNTAHILFLNLSVLGISVVVNCPSKKTAAGKSYLSALCRIVLLLNFRQSEQMAVKCMRGLLGHMIESILTDKELVKELKKMALHLEALDECPKDISKDQNNVIFGMLGVDINPDMDVSMRMPPTPAPSMRTASTRRAASTRRRSRQEVSSSSDEDASPDIVPATPSIATVRSQRASKTAAMSRLAVKNAPPPIGTDDEDEDEPSEVTSDEASEESDDGLAE